MGNFIDIVLTISIAIGFVFYLACMFFYCVSKEQLKTEALINLAIDEPKRRRRK